MLEQNHAQLVNGIQELYSKAVNGQAWVGPALTTLPNGHPHIHDILESLGVLKRDSRSGSALFEEDLELLQQRLYASGVGLMHPHDSADSDSEQTPCPMSGIESAPPRPFFTLPFAPSSGLPTPPMQTPPGRLSLHIPPEAQFRNQPQPQPQPQPQLPYKSQSLGNCPQTGMNPAVLHRQSWPQPAPSEDPMDFLRFEMPAYDNVRPMAFAPNQVDIRAMSPMAAPDWNEDDFNAYLHQGLG